jgi:hypothetical protein
LISGTTKNKQKGSRKGIQKQNEEIQALQRLILELAKESKHP